MSNENKSWMRKLHERDQFEDPDRVKLAAFIATLLISPMLFTGNIGFRQAAVLILFLGMVIWLALTIWSERRS